METLMHHPLGRYLEESSRREDENSVGGTGTIAVLIICLVLFCFIWAPPTFRRCRASRRSENMNQHNRQLANSDALAREATMIQNSLRAMMEQDASRRRFGGMSQEDRREYIDNVLMVKKAIPKPETDATTEGSLRRSKSDLLITAASSGDKDIDENDSNSGTEQCAICLTDYEDGDEICWSHNEECNHVFHRKCITEWLMSHEDCPCCRHHFLAFDDDDQVASVANATASSASALDENAQFVRGLQLFYHLAMFPNNGGTGSLFGELEMMPSPRTTAAGASRQISSRSEDSSSSEESDDGDSTTGYDQITLDGRAVHVRVPSDEESGIASSINDGSSDVVADDQDNNGTDGNERRPPVSVALACPDDDDALRADTESVDDVDNIDSVQTIAEETRDKTTSESNNS